VVKKNFDKKVFHKKNVLKKGEFSKIKCQIISLLLVNLFNNKKDRIMLVTGVFIVQGGEISRWCFCSLVLVVNFLTKVLFTSYSEFFVNVDQSFWLAEVFSWCSVISI
jgi:hypothetical protein